MEIVNVGQPNCLIGGGDNVVLRSRVLPLVFLHTSIQHFIRNETIIFFIENHYKRQIFTHVDFQDKKISLIHTNFRLQDFEMARKVDMGSREQLRVCVCC